MIINVNTHAVAQSSDGMMIIVSNDPKVNFDNIDIINDRAYLVNMFQEVISPELPIGVLTKWDPDWVSPTVELDYKKIKSFRQCK